MTRLLDRLERQGWVSRSREPTDRRVVTARITAEGRGVLDELEGPVAALHAGQLDRLEPTELRELRRLLQKVAGARPI